MHPTTTVTLVDGVRVVVPDSLDLITPYVLQEQLDWFEDEIKFLRRLLGPGRRVIDIGANCGVYALSLARAVGAAGQVWAFEPASGPAGLLAAGIAVNGYTQVTLERSALSSAAGAAQLSLHRDSEMNALARGGPAAGATEVVSVLTLDDCQESRGWRDIEFVKIDAEGEEANILKGGGRFFASESPLVQYEVKAGDDFHLELVAAFAALGYASYRLVPGLDLLAPFDAGTRPDGFLLNLFCCKPDRAARLAAAGYLAASAALPRSERPDAGRWRDSLARLPYATGLAGRWERTVAAGESGEVEEALLLYEMSREPSRPAAERFGALETGLGRLQRLCAGEPRYLRLASLARMARDYGAREVAARALAELCRFLVEGGPADPGEPFLAPGERFESVPPGDDFGNWILAAALEELERAGAYSSFYTGAAARQRLELIRDLGFGSAEMARRLSLVERRFGPPGS